MSDSVLKDVLANLSNEEIAKAFAGDMRGDLRAFCQSIGVPGDPRFLKDRVWGLIRTRLRGLSGEAMFTAAERLVVRESGDPDDDPGFTLYQIAAGTLVPSDADRPVPELVQAVTDLHGPDLTLLLLAFLVEGLPNGELLEDALAPLKPQG